MRERRRNKAHLSLDLPLISRHLVSKSSTSHLSSVVLEESDDRDVVGDLRKKRKTRAVSLSLSCMRSRVEGWRNVQ